MFIHKRLFSQDENCNNLESPNSYVCTVLSLGKKYMTTRLIEAV